MSQTPFDYAEIFDYPETFDEKVDIAFQYASLVLKKHIDEAWHKYWLYHIYGPPPKWATQYQIVKTHK